MSMEQENNGGRSGSSETAAARGCAGKHERFSCRGLGHGQYRANAPAALGDGDSAWSPDCAAGERAGIAATGESSQEKQPVDFYRVRSERGAGPVDPLTTRFGYTVWLVGFSWIFIPDFGACHPFVSWENAAVAISRRDRWSVVS